jgi:hypothetical protein
MPSRLHDRSVATVQTTDATVTTCGTYTVPTNSACQVEARVIGRTAGAVVGTFRNILNAQRAAGGAGAVGAEGVILVERDGGVLWTVALDVSGNDVRVRVTGAAATTIEWCAFLDVVTWTP